MKLKGTLRTCAVLLSLLLLGTIINSGLSMLVQKDDAAFWGGVMLLLASGLCLFFIGTVVERSIVKMIHDHFEKLNKGTPSVRSSSLPPYLHALAFCLVAIALSSCTRVGPGYVGIKVNYWGGSRGVDESAIVTGGVLYNPISTSIFEYPTFTQTAIWTKDKNEGSPNNEETTFNSKEGLVFSADISLSISLNATKVPKFYEKFRSDDINKWMHTFLRNIARDAFNEIAIQYTSEEIYGGKKEEMLKAVRDRMNAELAPYGVLIEQFGFVGAPRPPAGVTEAINAKIKATQDAIRVENELRQAKAEAAKAVAKAEGAAGAQVKMAEGEAKANQVLAQSITPALLEWRRLQIQSDAVARWDGKRPQVEGSGSGLLLNVNPSSK